MKQEEIKQLHQESRAQLQQMLEETQAKLAKAKLELKVGQLEDVNLTDKLSDDIARIKTVMREKQLLAEAKQALKQKQDKEEEKETNQEDNN
jgi:ribosomal protein L29